MTEKNMKVYEVAGVLGFDNAFYFSKVFRKVEGCSPSEYKRKQEITLLLLLSKGYGKVYTSCKSCCRAFKSFQVYL